MSCTVQIANHRKAIGLLYAGVQTAANTGVLQNQAGLAAALITTSFQLGSALGLAVFSGLFSGIAASRTSHLLAAHTPPPRRHSPPDSNGPCSSALFFFPQGRVQLVQR